MAETGAFIHVQFDFDLQFLQTGASNVSLQTVNVCLQDKLFILNITDFALQVDNKVCLRLDSSSAHAAVLALGQTKIILLLQEQVIDDAVFLLKFTLDHEEPRLDLSVLVFEVVSRHSLFHNVVVESFPFLIYLFWAQLAYLNLNHFLGFGAYWCVTGGIAG